MSFVRGTQKPLRLAALLVALALGGCQEQTLYSGLRQSEANQILAVLQTAGISATVRDEARGGTQAISVAPSALGDAVRVLSRAGLPRQKEASLKDVLPRDSWMASPLEERARLAYGFSQELTQTLTNIPGIVDARVHLALAEKNALGQTTADPTASVLVSYDTALLGAEFQDNIRSLVANSVAGLSYDRVTVTMVPYEGATEIAALQAGGGTAALGLSPRTSFSAMSVDILKILAVLLVALAATSTFLKFIRARR